MRKLLLLGTILTSTVFASAKLSLRSQYHILQKKAGATAGLSIYERLFSDDIHLNMWSGMGYRPGMAQDTGVMWYGTSTDIDFKVSSRWTVSPGFQLRFSPTFDDKDNSASVKVSYQIW